jgi:cysteinyl-tRNA synthetase, unknown class
MFLNYRLLSLLSCNVKFMHQQLLGLGMLLAALFVVPVWAEEVDISAVRTWMYQLQNIEDESALDALVASDYDLFVIEPTFQVKGSQSFPIEEVLERLKRHPSGKRRIVLAYVNVGQAEDYRPYWKRGVWKAPTKTRPGNPDFIVSADPDGWEGNYPVAYWRKAWQSIILGRNGLIPQVAEKGFDGAYLDWVGGYEEPVVRRQARLDGVRPGRSMIQFLQKIKARATTINPNFLVVPQNAPYLGKIKQADYRAAIDAVAFEDTWFGGVGGAPWGSSRGGDRKNTFTGDSSTEALVERFQELQALGLPVFTIDYALIDANAQFVYQQARAKGFIPLVTQIDLSQITGTPPGF